LGKNTSRNHPYVASTINNLGSVLKDLGDLSGARAAFERAIKIWKTILVQTIHKLPQASNNQAVC